jgi:ATP-binding cassette subfamily F protein uup
VLEALTAELPERIKAEEKRLEDPTLYARDPAGFDRLMKSLDALRAELAAAEEEWLMLEEKREALAASD